MNERKNPSKKVIATSAHGSKKQKQSSSGNSQAPFPALSDSDSILENSESVKSASELSSRPRVFLLSPTLILAPLVLGVQFTFFGAEGNSSGIAAFARTTSRGPCLQIVFFSLVWELSC